MNNINSVNKLLNVLSGSPVLHYDKWSIERAYRGIGEAKDKKWIANIVPAELLKRSLKRAVDSIITIV